MIGCQECSFTMHINLPNVFDFWKLTDSLHMLGLKTINIHIHVIHMYICDIFKLIIFWVWSSVSAKNYKNNTHLRQTSTVSVQLNQDCLTCNSTHNTLQIMDKFQRWLMIWEWIMSIVYYSMSTSDDFTFDFVLHYIQ